MTTLPALLLAAAGVGFGHAVLPDHWAPLAILGRARRYPLRRVLRQSIAAAVSHVVLSLALGAVLIVVGLRFRTAVQRHEDLVVGSMLLLTGAVMLVLAVVRGGHGHPHPHDHGHGHDHGHEQEHGHEHDHGQDHGQDHGREHGHDHGPGPAPGRREGLALLVPFGVAASPDLTILPVFLAAGAVGPAAAVGSLAVFAAVTVATIVGLTALAAVGARTLTGAWADRGADLLAAVTLLLLGGLVTAGVI